MKEQIAGAIEYLKEVSLKEPQDIQVEEISGNKIVLSFTYKGVYIWSIREYKEFTVTNAGFVSKMEIFIPKP